MTCFVGEGRQGTKYLYYRCETCKVLLPEKRITDEYLPTINELMNKFGVSKDLFAEMEFSEQRTILLKHIKSIMYDPVKSSLSIQYIGEKER